MELVAGTATALWANCVCDSNATSFSSIRTKEL
jgi:hypothetical protein